MENFKKTHIYSELPQKGFTKSMDGVNVNEAVIIDKSLWMDINMLYFFKQEVQSRAHQLKAFVSFTELPPKTINESSKAIMWFSDKL